MDRKTIREWEGVKISNFPLVIDKDLTHKNERKWVFGGRYFTITGHWAGVSYLGRYVFYTPLLDEDEIISRVWDLREVEEKGEIINAKGEKLTISRRYYCLEPSESQVVKYHARFVGGHYKTTLKGYGRDRDYSQNTKNNDAEIICKTSNSSRSGRFGSYACLVISSSPIYVEEEGVF